ncbi:MAG TPA: hypothetical protein VD931_22710 [Baekduia sp.]|nr:hypothetical protein [Baekduia sp.]
MPTLNDIITGLREQAADTFENASKRVRPAAAAAEAAPEPVARSPRGAIPHAPMTAVEGVGVAKTPGDAAAALNYRDGARAANITTGAPAGPSSPVSWSATTTGAPGVQSPTVDDLAKKYIQDRLATNRATQATMAQEALQPKQFTGVRSNYVAPQPAPMMPGVGGSVPPQVPGSPAAAAPAGEPKPPMGKMAKLGAGLGLAAGGVQAGFGVQAAREGRYGDAVDNAFQGAATMLNPMVGVVGNVLTGLRDAGMRAGIENFVQPTRNPGLYTPELERIVQGGEFTGRRPQGAAAETVRPAAPVAASVPGTPAAAPSGPDNMIRTTRGARVTADQLIDGKDVPAPGQGAIRRGSEPAVKVGAKVDAPDAPTPGDSKGRGLRGATGGTLASHMVNLAALNMNAKAAAAKESGAAKQAELGIKDAAHRLNVYKTREELRAKTKADIEKEVEDTVMRGMDSSLKKEEREALGAKGKAELMSRVRHTAANRGMDLGDLSGAERRKILDGEKFRRALVGSRDETLQQVKDYFGQKRFDSDDLASYMPKTVKRDGARGYIIETENGNTMTVRAAAGGRFVLMGPNTPVDADLMQHIFRAAENQSKGR